MYRWSPIRIIFKIIHFSPFQKLIPNFPLPISIIFITSPSCNNDISTINSLIYISFIFFTNKIYPCTKLFWIRSNIQINLQFQCPIIMIIQQFKQRFTDKSFFCTFAILGLSIIITTFSKLRPISLLMNTDMSDSPHHQIPHQNPSFSSLSFPSK